jgi:hypothetical protein
LSNGIRLLSVVRWEKWIGGSNGRLPVLTGPALKVHGPSLSFSRVEKSHNGSYRCEVANSFGSIVLDYHLLLQTKPVLTLEPKKKILLRIGQSVELTCKLVSSFLTDMLGIHPGASNIIEFK